MLNLVLCAALTCALPIAGQSTPVSPANAAPPAQRSSPAAEPATSIPPQTIPPPQQVTIPAQQTPPAKPADDLPDSPSTVSNIAVPPAPDGPTVLFDTTMGRLSCQFFEKEAPLTVANFIGLATGTKDFTDPTTHQKMHGVRFFDGTTFHRVIANFMIQGGDRIGNGMGDPGFYIPDEFAPGLRFDREGRLAMANAGPGTGGSQFFITEGPTPELNGKHTIFGQCDPHSVLVVQTIARVEKTANDRPVTPVVINRVTIVPEGGAIPPDPMAPAATPARASDPAAVPTRVGPVTIAPLSAPPDPVAPTPKPTVPVVPK